MTATPSSVLYFDLMSPYAYLAVERVASVLPEPPELEPVLLGAIFKVRGSGSWAHTALRNTRIAEIEARAKRYGLPPLAWPRTWPSDSLPAMRAATWAKEQGRGEEFAKAVFRAQFVRGHDGHDIELLAACADEAGLDRGETADAIQHPAVKQRLRDATDAAWQAGVRGVPTLVAGDAVYFGDDQLELAASRFA